MHWFRNLWRRNRPRYAFFGVIFVMIISIIYVSPTNTNLADYGDAPDGLHTGYPEFINNNPTGFAQIGSFPTLLENDGARTLSVDDVTLGPNASLENNADDNNDPDGNSNLAYPHIEGDPDFDDGVVLWEPPLTPPSWVIFVHSQIGGAFYLNGLLDRNLDGMWIQQEIQPTEWVITNERINVDPNGITMIRLDDFGLVENDYLGLWMRVMITTEPIQTDWYGQGEFASGEVEDVWLILGESSIPGGVCPPESPACSSP